MASSCKYFEEDAVFRMNRKGIVEFGLILENSEFISSDEDEEEERNIPSWERMKRGHVRVAWHPRGHEEVLLEKKVKLFDRSLMPGDVVRRLIKGKDTQLGYCRSTDVRAAVQIVGHKQVITDVKSTELTPLEDYSADIAVFLDSWVGIVKSVKSEVTVRCNDGSRCVLSDDDALDLDDILDRRDKVSEFRKFSFYPNQQLWGPIHCFEKARWLHTTKEMQSLLTKPGRSIWVTVEQVKVVSMGVQWLCRAYCEGSVIVPAVEQPKYTVAEDDLPRVKMMHIFEPCALQTGDRNYYIVKDTDHLMMLDEWRKNVTTRMGPPVFTAPKAQLLNPPPEIHVQEPKPDSGPPVSESHETHNGVGGSESDFEDIEDDDGNTSDTGSVTSRSTASSIGTKVSKSRAKKGPSLATKFLKKKKLRRARKKVILEALPIKPGERVVTETLVTETKASVRWQDGSTEENISSASLYPIHHIDGHEFFPGDFVMENKDNPIAHEYGVVQKVDHTGRTALVTWLNTYLAGSDPHPVIVSEEEISVYDIKDHPDFRYSPGSCVIRVAHFEDNDPHNTAGQVLDVLPTGKVEVCWVSGKTSHCYPQELYRIGEYDSDDLWADDDSSDDEDSWETDSDRSLTGTLDSGEEAEKSPEKPGKPTVSLPEEGTCEKACGGREEGLKNLNLGSEANVAVVKEKLLAKIEKLRAGMARMEELFTQNPCLQNTTLMRKLLEIYRHCRLLDQLLGTFYFHEKHLQSLVEQLRQRGRINSAQHMANQISRLFSSSDNNTLTETDLVTEREENFLDCSVMLLDDYELSDAASFNDRLGAKKENSTDNNSDIKSTNDAAECGRNAIAVDTGFGGRSINDGIEALAAHGDQERVKTIPDQSVTKNLPGVSSPISQKVCASEASPSVRKVKDSEPPNACKQLFQLLRVRLLKAHEDLQQIFGMPLSRTSDALQAASNDTSPKHEVKSADTTSLESDTNLTSTDVQQKPEESKVETLMSELNLDDVRSDECEMENTAGQGVFCMDDTVSDIHKFKLSIFQPGDPRPFFKTVRKELQLLRSSLPEGIIVKGFEDRMDLYSVLIKGSKRTPYEDGLFLFDFQLPMDYPKSPPLCHYISYCSDRLNPNLYEGGRVCVSLLGTWGGKGTEIWNPATSNLLQVIVSIQGLILVAEPYYNEAGYERQRGTQQGKENSRMYNEMVVLKLIQATSMMITSPPDIFKEEILEHFQKQAPQFVERLEKWLNISEKWNTSHPMTPVTPTAFRDMHKDAFDFAVYTSLLPEYPLLPASKGFCLTLRKSFSTFKDTLKSAGINLD